jgi:uncharacterized protein YndB with AHSA1/START domain
MTWQHSGQMVKETIETSAPVKKLWAAVTDNSLIRQWFADHSTGKTKLGETITWTWDTLHAPWVLEVLAAEPENLLVFRHGDRILELKFSPWPKGSRLELTHSGFAPDAAGAEDFASAQSMWHVALTVLKFHIENYPDQNKKSITVFRAMQFDFAKAHIVFKDAARIPDWLKDDDPPRQVLADSGREVCYRWDAIGGVLECGALTLGGVQYLALRAISWSRMYDLSTRKAELEQSLANLAAIVAP